MVRSFVFGAALAGALVGAVGLERAQPIVRENSSALARSDGAVMRTQGEACTDACRREHSDCMIRSKGSPSCNARLQQCLQACLARRRQ
ncbi:MAG: hypothetical protein ACM31O_15310 [Bacteroidota bacterium]